MNATDHMGLVRHVLNKMSLRDSDEADEMYSDGLLGLVDACNRFDESLSVAASTYLVPRIRGAILDGIRRRDTLSRGLRQSVALIDSGELSRKELVVARSALLAVQQVSLDTPNDTGHSISETVGSADPPVLDFGVSEDMDAIHGCLGKIHPRLKYVIEQSYLHGTNLSEIADALKVTESRVSQLRTRAVGLIQTLLAGEELPLLERWRKGGKPYIVSDATRSHDKISKDVSNQFCARMCKLGVPIAKYDFIRETLDFGITGGLRASHLAEISGINRNTWKRRFQRVGLASISHWISAGNVIEWTSYMWRSGNSMRDTAIRRGRCHTSLRQQAHRLTGHTAWEIIAEFETRDSVWPAADMMVGHLTRGACHALENVA